MGKARFPLINARKDIFGKWHTYPYVGESSETIVVPSEPNEFGYYTAWLLEIPDQNVRVRIEGLKERTENASVSTLAQDEYYVNYQTGEVLFNAAQAGNEFLASYHGRGSLIEADDLNMLNDNVLNFIDKIQDVTIANEKIDALEESSNKIQGQFSELEASVIGIEDRVVSIEESTTNNSQRIDLLDESSSSVDQRVSTLENSIVKAQEQISSLETSSEGTLSRVTSIEDALIKIQDRTSALESYSEDLSQKVVALEESSANTEERVATAETSLSDVTQRMVAVEEDLVKTKEQVSALEEAGTNAVQRIESLEDGATKTQEQIADVENNVRELEVGSDAELITLNQKIKMLEDKVSSLKIANAEEVVITAETTKVNSPTADLVISSGEEVVTTTSTITGKSITVKNFNVDSVTVNLKTAGAGDINISNWVSTGSMDPEKNAAQLNTYAAEYVTVRDCTFGMGGYNGIQFGTTNTVVKGVLIENCKFTGELSNSAVNVYNTADNATVTLNNVHFAGKCRAAIRLGNADNVRVTVNMINCKFDYWNTEEAPRQGCIYLRDSFATKDATESNSRNVFAPEKVTFNFINCIGPDGNKIDYTGVDPSLWIATGTAEQFCYIRDAVYEVVPYSADRYPTFNFK